MGGPKAVVTCSAHGRLAMAVRSVSDTCFSFRRFQHGDDIRAGEEASHSTTYRNGSQLSGNSPAGNVLRWRTSPARLRVGELAAIFAASTETRGATGLPCRLMVTTSALMTSSTRQDNPAWRYSG